MTPLAKLLEAALFASARPLPVEELQALDPEASPAAVRAALDEIRETYDNEGHGVELLEVGGGWQVLTRAEYTEAIERAQLAARPARLSAAALETLAIIAYRQPIGRAEIEEIRGVAVGGVLKSLHERGIIDVVGRAEGLGRPLLYGTTPLFLEQFALRHLGELPRADELAIALRGADGVIPGGATTSVEESAPEAATEEAPAGEGEAPVEESLAEAAADTAETEDELVAAEDVAEGDAIAEELAAEYEAAEVDAEDGSTDDASDEESELDDEEFDDAELEDEELDDAELDGNADADRRDGAERT